MQNNNRYSGENVGPEGAAAARFTEARRGLTNRERWTEGGATASENAAPQCTERGSGASPQNDGKC